MFKFVLKVLKTHNCEKKGKRSCLACATGGLLHIIKAGDYTIAETFFKISIKKSKKDLKFFAVVSVFRDAPFYFLLLQKFNSHRFFTQYKKNMYIHVSRTNEQKVFRSVHTVEDGVISNSPV
jgi:hypothetical protein